MCWPHTCLKRQNYYKAFDKLMTMITAMVMMCVLVITSRLAPLCLLVAQYQTAMWYNYIYVFCFYFRLVYCLLQNPFPLPVYISHSLSLFWSHQISLHTINQMIFSCLYVNESYTVSAPDKPQITKVTVTAPDDSHLGSLHVTWQVGIGSSHGVFCIFFIEICQILLKQIGTK